MRKMYGFRRLFRAIHAFNVFIFVLPAVALRAASLSPAPLLVSAGDDILANCCATGYPQPIITINGKLMQSQPILNNGIYEGCASTTIATANFTVGAEITSNCSVKLNQSMNCTRINQNGSISQVFNNCEKALTHTSFVKTTTVIAGK